MKNKANFNSVKLTATSYSERAYNDLSPKTQNGTKPNKANLKPISNILTLFVRSFGSLQGASLRSSEVVRVVRRAMDDWPATPQGDKRTTKTSLFSGMTPIPQKLFYGKRTQFRQPNSTANSCNKVTYNALRPKGNEPKRTQLKPIKANLFVLLLSTFYRSTLSGQRPATQTNPIFPREYKHI